MTTTPVTFVNVLDVDPARQQELVDLLSDGAEQVMLPRPGFVSLRILASLDGTRVVNVAEWSDAESVEATQADPDAAAWARRAAEIAASSPGLYRVVAEHRA